MGRNRRRHSAIRQKIQTVYLSWLKCSIHTLTVSLQHATSNLNSSSIQNSTNWLDSELYYLFLVQQQGLFLINNKISKIHPKAFRNMDHLRLLYLSYNLLTEIPANLPPNVFELRLHENKINKIQKDAFRGLRKLHVLGETCLQLLVSLLKFSKLLPVKPSANWHEDVVHTCLPCGCVTASQGVCYAEGRTWHQENWHWLIGEMADGHSDKSVLKCLRLWASIHVLIWLQGVGVYLS